MSKPNNKPAQPKAKAFHKDKDVAIYVTQAGSKITGFRADFGNKVVEVKVIKEKILEAFKKFENHPLIKKL